MRSKTTSLRFTFLLLTILCLNSHCLFARYSTNADEQVVAQLKRFRTDYTSNILEGKPELLAMYYAEGIRLMPEFQKTIIGKSNVMTYQAAFSARFAIQSLSRSEVETLDLGRRVVEIGSFAMKVNLKSTSKGMELNGKYLDIWEKQGNGKLTLVTEAWNYNHPLELEEQMRISLVSETNVALQPHLPINSPISFELAALNKLMEATVSQHDANIWSQFYTEDGMFLYSRHPMYQGKKELNLFLEKHVKELPVFEKLDIRNDRIDDLGSYVIEYASHIAVWRAGDYSGIGLGKDLRIWRREKEGSLKIFRHIGMYD